MPGRGVTQIGVGVLLLASCSGLGSSDTPSRATERSICETSSIPCRVPTRWVEEDTHVILAVDANIARISAPSWVLLTCKDTTLVIDPSGVDTATLRRTGPTLKLDCVTAATPLRLEGDWDSLLATTCQAVIEQVDQQCPGLDRLQTPLGVWDLLITGANADSPPAS